MSFLQFGTEQVCIYCDHQGSDPHSDEEVGKGLLWTAFGTKGTKAGSEQCDTEGTPHVPLSSDFLIVTLSRHCYLNLIKDIIKISFLFK